MEESEVKTLMDGIAEKNGVSIRNCVQAETKALWDVVAQQGEAIRKNSGASYGSVDHIGRIIQGQSSAIKALHDGDKRSIRFTVPKTLVTRALVSGSTMAMRLNEIGQLPYAQPIISTLFPHAPVSPSSGGVIRYYDQAAVTRNAASVAEGGTKPESAASWIERSIRIEKVADTIPVTKEALQDIFLMESEIRKLLEINLALKVDDLLYDGDGVTPNIKGVYTSAPAFVTTAYADTVEGANIFDLIMVVAADISSGAGGKYMADTVLLNPANMLGLNIAKDSGGRYLLPPFASMQGGLQTIGGMKIVASSQVTVNTMVVGDFRFGTIYDLEDVTVEVGFIDQQFIQNKVTVLAEQRLALLIRTVDETAFRKVTNITTALADLETP